jgi:hypothetical protein
MCIDARGPIERDYWPAGNNPIWMWRKEWPIMKWIKRCTDKPLGVCPHCEYPLNLPSVFLLAPLTWSHRDQATMSSCYQSVLRTAIAEFQQNDRVYGRSIPLTVSWIQLESFFFTEVIARSHSQPLQYSNNSQCTSSVLSLWEWFMLMQGLVSHSSVIRFWI